MQLWTKVESIDAKLDQRMAEHEKRLIVLEIDSIDRKDFFALEGRVTDIEKHDESHHATEDALRENKDQLRSYKTFVFGLAASTALIVNTLISFYLIFNQTS